MIVWCGMFASSTSSTGKLLFAQIRLGGPGGSDYTDLRVLAQMASPKSGPTAIHKHRG